jgi:hypothetical protein
LANGASYPVLYKPSLREEYQSIEDRQKSLEIAAEV